MNAAATTTTKGSKKTSKATNASKIAKGSGESITLGQLADKYIKHLQQDGKSAGTVFSYSMDMQIATPLPKMKGGKVDLGGLDLKKIDDLDTLRIAIGKLRGEMKAAAEALEFERAAQLRDKARELEQLELQMR